MGEQPLSNRELDVLRHVAEGNRNREIGKHLFISEETVKVHVKHIMEKLGASDRTHAMTIATRRGFISTVAISRVESAERTDRGCIQ